MKSNIEDALFLKRSRRRCRLRYRYERNGKRYKIEEDSPSWESMSPQRYHYNRQHTGQNYIRSLLYRNVGRRWDEFYSDFCQRLKSQRDVKRRDALSLLNWEIKAKITDRYGEYDYFYIDPITNLICLNQEMVDREFGCKKKRQEKRKKNIDYFRIDRFNVLEKDYDGTWYQYVLRVIPPKIYITDPAEPEHYQQLVKTGSPPWKSMTHCEMEELGYTVHQPLYDYTGYNDVHDPYRRFGHWKERGLYRAIRKTPSHAVLKKAGVRQLDPDD